MEPFNLEEYLKDPSRKVVTRDGRNVRIICTDKRGTDFPIVALVECEDKEETCYYPPNGCWNLYGKESDIDLFFAPKKTEGWINIYKNPSGYAFPSHIFKTKEEAEKTGKECSGYYMTTSKIEWEE